MNPIRGTRIIVGQIDTLLDSIDNETLKTPLSTFNGSSIGQHLRHIIDFYLCLIKGAKATNVDYDNRERNPDLEKDIKVVNSALQQIANQVEDLDIYKIINVHSSFTSSQSETTDFISSSLGRELMYAYDHAIHHLAMIKIGMQIHFPNIKLDKNLGVAPSTIKYRQRLQQVSN